MKNINCDKAFFPPEINQSIIMLVDMQEKFMGAMPDNIQAIITRQKILLEASKLLNVPVIVTEQYPKGLGKTIPELANILDPSWPVYEKTTFSCFGSTAVRMELQKENFNTVILLGIEAHVCILQTALDAVSNGFQTIILKDTVNSRKIQDLKTSFDTAKAAGVHFMTVESLLFMLMRESTHPAFRDISKLLK